MYVIPQAENKLYNIKSEALKNVKQVIKKVEES